ADFGAIDVGAAAIHRIGVEVDRGEQAGLNIAPVDMKGGDVDAEGLADQVNARADFVIPGRVASKGQRQAGYRCRIDVDAADPEPFRIERIDHGIARGFPGQRDFRYEV